MTDPASRTRKRATRAASSASMLDVARAAGVSAQTVSRVLRADTKVREETRQKVNRAVAELGYARNRAASVLSAGRSRVLGVVTLVSRGYTRLEFLVGAERAASELGYEIEVVSAGSLDDAEVHEAVVRAAARDVDAVVLSIPARNAPESVSVSGRTIPVFSVAGLTDQAHEYRVDAQRLIGETATGHLLELGHHTVWHISGPESWSDARMRVDGWRAALESAGAEVPPVLRGDWSPESGYENGRVLASIPGVTAVFVANDEMAFGVIRALSEAGISVPGQIAVVSCDDLPLAAYANPPLTTIAQPIERTGEQSVRFAVASLVGDQPSPIDVPLPTLVVRASSGGPRR